MNYYLAELGYNDAEQNYKCVYRLVKANTEDEAKTKIETQFSPNSFPYKLILTTIE